MVTNKNNYTMRKLLLFACALFGFMACTQNPIEEQSAIRTDAPETLRVGFEDDETRIQLNSAQKTVWTKDDLVSVFYKSNANQKWEYRGETGERVASLYRVDAGIASRDMDYVVLAYPYSADYVISATTGNIEATLPATQYYTKGSYGIGSNLMVSQSEFTQFSLKSVCGWLKLQLTGDGEVVKSIKFRGNDGEQVAGLIYVDTATAEATLASEMGSSDDNNAGGNLIFDDTIITEVVLDCGEGVTLGKSATAFYIALPPQTFANGFTVDIECEDYELMTLTTEKELVIERNHIQPMASVEHNAEQIIPNNEIWYTTTTNSKASIVTNANEVSHEYKDGKGVIVYDADVTTLVVSDFAVETISIPSTITKWNQLRFYGFNLKKLIGDNVSDDGRCLIVNGELLMFASKGLTEYTFPNNITKIGNESCRMAYSVSKFVIPEGVTAIGEGAFHERYDVDNSPILTVELPSTLQTISSYAFYNAKIETINIPSSVNYIGHDAFTDRNNCINLLSTTPCEIGGKICEDSSIINVPESNWKSYVYSDDWCEIAHLVRINGEVPNYDSIPCFQLWYTSTNGELIDFNISHGHFGSTSIISNVYQNGRGVITCAGPIREIAQGAFTYWASSFKTITLPSSIRTIGSGAFYYHDNNLTDVYCNIATPPTGGEEMFYNNYDNIGNIVTIYVPATSIDDYKNANYWKECNIVGYDFENGVVVTPKPANNEIWYTNSSTTATTPANTDAFGANIVSNTYDATKECWVIKFDGDVTSVGFSAFYQCSNLTSVTIPDSVTSIGDEAFLLCSNLTSVSIPDNVTEIGGGAFYGCYKLQEFDGKIASEDGRCLILNGVLHAFAPDGITEYTIPNGVTTIENSVFYGCDSLTSITISNSVTTIEDYAFANCSSLTSITIPDSVTTIGDYTFRGCSSLTSVTIGDSVTLIGSSTFESCSNLNSVIIPEGVTKIESSTFEGCSSLTSITIPDSVTEIGDYAFSGCSSLTSITIPDSVTSIGNYTFINCRNLTSVYCEPTTPPTGGTDMFYNISSDCKIYVPMESAEAYKSANGWKKYAFGIVGYNF